MMLTIYCLDCKSPRSVHKCAAKNTKRCKSCAKKRTKLLIKTNKQSKKQPAVILKDESRTISPLNNRDLITEEEIQRRDEVIEKLYQVSRGQKLATV